MSLHFCLEMILMSLGVLFYNAFGDGGNYKTISMQKYCDFSQISSSENLRSVTWKSGHAGNCDK